MSTSAKGRTYSRMLFGGFLEHFHRQIYGGIFEPGSPLADAKGFRKDVIEAIKELRTPIVRWPGGCFVSAYHWKDGVGKDRQPSFDKAWGVEDPNTFGTDEFVEWCRLAGIEPYICGNAGTGTPEEMSDWVEYCNQTQGRWARLRMANGHPEPFNVRYWSVGNENWGGHEIGAKTSQEWGLFVRETVKMIRRTDPSVILTAAALGDDWNRNLLQHAGHRLNMISIHGYWDGLWVNDRPSDYATCMMRSTQPEESIVTVERLLDSTGFKGRITIAFDEWNLRGWHHPGVETGFGPDRDQGPRPQRPQRHLHDGRRALLGLLPELLPAPCRHGEDGQHRAAGEHARPAVRASQGHRQADHLPCDEHVRQPAGAARGQGRGDQRPVQTRQRSRARRGCGGHLRRGEEGLADRAGEPPPLRHRELRSSSSTARPRPEPAGRRSCPAMRPRPSTTWNDRIASSRGESNWHSRMAPSRCRPIP